MPQMSKVELYAAIRRGHRAGMTMRELERKYNVVWQTVRKALNSAWPEPRKPLPPRPSVEPDGGLTYSSARATSSGWKKPVSCGIRHRASTKPASAARPTNRSWLRAQ